MEQHNAHTAFDTAHPAVAALYGAVTLIFTMAAIQPVLIAISLAGALAYGVVARGVRASLAALRWQLPVIAILAILNPFFSASGSTELFRVGERAVYLESLAYGASMGALLAASMLWFQAAASMLPADRAMTLLGNAAPVVALMVSMTMRMVPGFVAAGRSIATARRSVTPDGIGAPRAASARLRMVSALMSGALEDSLETADAMRARGWGAAPRRTSYIRYRFTAADAIEICALAGGALVCAALAATATAQFSFYPVMTKLVPWWGYVPFAAWMALPCGLHIRETARFR